MKMFTLLKANKSPQLVETMLSIQNVDIQISILERRLIELDKIKKPQEQLQPIFWDTFGDGGKYEKYNEQLAIALELKLQLLEKYYLLTSGKYLN